MLTHTKIGSMAKVKSSKCSECKGEGFILVQVSGTIGVTDETCPKCGGSGKAKTKDD